MPPHVDLYDSAYSNYEADVYRQVRIATYGEDLGLQQFLACVHQLTSERRLLRYLYSVEKPSPQLSGGEA